ncbi:MAG: YggS family pyridoxal phosphate-dependent enzyme [Gammaproteobacteria bacterium]|nr:YggS family pyridoxal phosphate-dependent enzyme [Gammaproteobacteria bacterium]
MTSIADNISSVIEQIQEFERKYQRGSGAVVLLAVSKQQDVASIRLAYAAGLKNFGENYLQEAEPKIQALRELDICWHFIGPIQTNKTRGIATHFSWVHSVDREKVARRLSEQRDPALGPLNVCVQVNLSLEASKSGVELAECRHLCELVSTLPNLRLRGLMAIPAPSNQLAAQRAGFRRLAAEYHLLAQRYPTLDTLSMGMSNDFEAAIAEGTTLVRIGSALFGARH